MKSLLGCICLYYLIPTLAHSQSMLEPGKQWIFEDMHYSTIWFPFSDTTIETITIEKDTIINSQVYSKLVLSRHPSCWNTATVEYLREDGEKIFRLSRDHQQEFLMIDFAETTGYQMLYDNGLNTIDTGTVIIDSFGTDYAYDDTLLEVQFVRILNNQSFDDDTPYKVYKNIGFLYPGLLFPDLGTGLCDFQDGITLRCVATQQDTIQFTSFDCFELQHIDHVSPIHTETVILYPNPSTAFILIPPGYDFLDMFHSSGIRMAPCIDSNRIYVDTLPAGMYVVRFVKGGKVFVGVVMRG